VRSVDRSEGRSYALGGIGHGLTLDPRELPQHETAHGRHGEELAAEDRRNGRRAGAHFLPRLSRDVCDVDCLSFRCTAARIAAMRSERDKDAAGSGGAIS
jgi:hypothetical protein